MSQNSDALKGAYESFNSGDLDGVVETFADDIRWEGPNTDGVPMSRLDEVAVLAAYLETTRRP